MEKDEKLKAERLWRHLKILDEHLLIRVWMPDSGNEKVMTVYMDTDGELRTDCVEVPPEGFGKWVMGYGHAFVLVQQRNEDGRFIIPDVNEWERDKNIDS